MTRYATSLSGRLLAASASFLLMCGGIAALLRIPTELAMPVLLLPVIIGGLFAIGMGIESYPQQTGLLIVLVPLFAFPTVVALGLAVQKMPTLGWGFIAVGVIPIIVVIRAAIPVEGSQRAGERVSVSHTAA